MHWWRRKNKIHRKCTCIKCGLIFIQDQGYLTNDWQRHTLYYISVNQLCLPVIMMRNEHFPPKNSTKSMKHINEVKFKGHVVVWYIHSKIILPCLSMYWMKELFEMFVTWHSRTNALTKYGWFIGIMESGHVWL